MATKVLVFESDAAFAGELRNELGKFGCNTKVVDDGNVGLQQAASDRPDLILLSIELPRMNGFSVCNKLKKDPALKDVPLIIMSSESSEETFEQHRKLRTRAEDYVHKPIAFGELLQHIQAFVALAPQDAVGPAASQAPGPASDGGIVIEDEIAIASSVYLDDEGGMTQIARRPPEFARPKPPAPAVQAQIDKDVDDFAEGAFDRLTSSRSASPPPLPLEDAPRSVHPAPANGTSGAASVAPPPASVPPPPRPRQPSIPPRPAGIDVAEHERVKGDLEKSRSRATDLEKELGGAKADISRLQDDVQRGSKSDAESQRMQRELDELKAKLATTAKAGGGISSRDFLDLREALNKKDKEILALREALTKKDKDSIDTQDKLLALERAKADLEDKGLATERDLADAKDKIEALSADKDLAKKASEDWKTRFERLKGDAEGKLKELSDARAKHAEDLAAQEGARAKLKAELEQVLTSERAASQKSVEQAEASRKAEAEAAEALRKSEAEQAEALRGTDFEQAQRDRDAAVAEAKETAAKEKAEAIAAREASLKSETDSKLASLHRAHQQELEKTKAELAQQAKDETSKHLAELAAAEERRQQEVSDAEQVAAAKLAEREVELEAKRAAEVSSVERDRETRLTALATEAAERVAAMSTESTERIAAMSTESTERIAALENDRDARIAALEARTSRELEDAALAAEAQTAASDERIATLEADLSATRAELSALSEAKTATDASNAAKVADLESRLADATTQRDEHAKNLSATRDRVAVLEAELASTRQELTETTQAHVTQKTRAEGAFTKWESDRASLERAKDALAVALAQIEEAETRPITGGSAG